ncbi:MAG TPA: polysaccharide biosynthesis/export family protein [Paraburkholderia sp.]|jgi:polysaccharide export outer membrane protein
MGIRITVYAAAVAAAAILSGCAIAPGMRVDARNANANANANAQARQPSSVIEITADLVSHAEGQRSLVAERDEAEALIAATQPYRIGAADVLSVIVWDHPELVVPNLTYDIGATGGSLPASVGLTSQTVPGFVVGHEGTIQFPYVRQLKVAGLTETEAQTLLVSRLKPYIHDPQISLRVVGFRSKKVYVNGEVHAPGVKPITDVPMTLANALHVADGALSTGDLSRVELIRAGRRYRIDVPHLAERGLDATRIALDDSDEVRVPPATDFSVFMMGEVQKPGPLPFHSDGRLTLAQALGQAAANPATSNPAQVYLVRPAAGDTAMRVFHLDAQTPIALALAHQFPLQPNDIVYVDTAGVVRWNRVISQLTGSTSAAYAVERAALGK